MSSITTAVPIGLISKWCVLVPGFNFNVMCEGERGNDTSSVFQNICCGGTIVNTKNNTMSNNDDDDDGIPDPVYLEDLACCRPSESEGDAAIFPPPFATSGTTCPFGTPTPLASLAATNTANVASVYEATIASAFYSLGLTDPLNGAMLQTPYCFWAKTKGMQVETVTLPAPDITRYTTTEDQTGGLITVTIPPTSIKTATPSVSLTSVSGTAFATSGSSQATGSPVATETKSTSLSASADLDKTAGLYAISNKAANVTIIEVPIPIRNHKIPRLSPSHRSPVQKLLFTLIFVSLAR
ncbi:hypothetical protein G7Y89_g3762 [Cudoniella acicularis]|uniref:Uncharacterized protein n=1 Tax=Cudoniella acicularis TaxID=354080 RepID=A0A8H4W5M7_9HELO|nr:hypothetical protein G7Y89_g3762 [Cudoniella acicularis]